MSTSFEFATAQRIIFGSGVIEQLPDLAESYSGRALVVSGRSQPRVQGLIDGWRTTDLVAATHIVQNEPSVGDIQAGATAAHAATCDFVIAIGGGSVLDTGKAIAALLTNPGEPLDYLEVVGRGQKLLHPAAPVIAVPTTAGAGAEVTRNAVLNVPEQKVKVSLRHPSMLPAIALVDPELTHSMPREVTASTGLDALTQCIEPLVSSRANPLSDAMAREGIRRAAAGLPRAVEHPDDTEARSDMALASLCGGLALANAKLGAVHAYAGVLGGMYTVPHGVVCARLLPFVFSQNIAALDDRRPDSPLRARFDEVARLLTGRHDAAAEDAVAWLDALCTALDVPGLAHYGVAPDAFAAIIAQSQRASSMQGNPLPLLDSELQNILEKAL